MHHYAQLATKTILAFKSNFHSNCTQNSFCPGSYLALCALLHMQIARSACTETRAQRSRANKPLIDIYDAAVNGTTPLVNFQSYKTIRYVQHNTSTHSTFYFKTPNKHMWNT